MNDSWFTKITNSLVIGFVLTALSYAIGMYMGWIDTVSWLEAFSVFTSYSCTYLCVKQSRLNYPFGMVSTAALTVLFFQQGLYSSMALNAYLVPTLIWGFYRWGSDKDTRPVKFVEMKWWPAYLGLTGLTYGLLLMVTNYFGAALPATDAFILVGSILAQFLLDNKKIETWAVWILVNVVAIYTYWQAGLILVAFQFIFFLGNAFWGAYSWRKTMKKKETEDYISEMVYENTP